MFLFRGLSEKHCFPWLWLRSDWLSSLASLAHTTLVHFLFPSSAQRVRDDAVSSDVTHSLSHSHLHSRWWKFSGTINSNEPITELYWWDGSYLCSNQTLIYHPNKLNSTFLNLPSNSHLQTEKTLIYLCPDIGTCPPGISPVIHKSHKTLQTTCTAIFLYMSSKRRKILIMR